MKTKEQNTTMKTVTVGDLMNVFSKLPKDAIVTNPSQDVFSITLNEEDTCENCENCACSTHDDTTRNNAITMTDHMMMTCDGVYTPDEAAQLYKQYQESMYPEDDTAMTLPS